jgi:leucyl-tRNA synthetase
VGGIEHAILHLLYSRFFTKVLRDRGLLGFDEPFRRLLTQGMVLSNAFVDADKRYYRAEEVAQHPDGTWVERATGKPVNIVMEKMSKSKYNGIDPLTVLSDYGADTARLFILFKAPPEKELEWSDSDVEGQYRFLGRVWRVVHSAVASTRTAEVGADEERTLRREVHTAIKKVTEDIEFYQFNTAISALMVLTNKLTDYPSSISPAYREGVAALVPLLAPLAPHIASELWEALGHPQDVHRTPWPRHDPQALVEDALNVVVQVNGKKRAEISVPAASAGDQAEMERLALAEEGVRRHTDGKTVRKVILVPGKLINVVVS